MFNKTLAAGLLLTAGIAGTICARAADMPALFPQPGYAELDPPTQMEFGTGWYLRGDVTATDDTNPRILGGIDRQPRDWGYGIGGGAGYKFTDYFRADITGDYLSSQTRSVTVATGNTGQFLTPLNGPYAERATFQRWDSLVNGYVDLGNWSGLTPYIGAGVGVGGLRTSGSFTTADGTRTKLSGRDTYNLAWAAMAGVSYAISPHLLLDVGYRYLDLGTYRAPHSNLAQQDLFATQKSDLNAHEVRVGFRYQID